MHLQQAQLWYGTQPYDVKPEDLRGVPGAAQLPTEFNFKDPVGCAVKVLRALSGASGGHPLRDGAVTIHRGRHTASVVASGASAHYAPRDRAHTLTAEQALRIMAESERHEVGTVNQYGVVPMRGANPAVRNAPRWR